ncbi:hypothetical protein PR048_001672 [Dryococelus australis]|uniref:Uncharacterized protein n=1 Tax=Dryococelus australis TaxID=614101 RepID=A0ABQ9II10_9NEOP|nr:hypothetical protein PR048_001672 [Dryococelus australis]
MATGSHAGRVWAGQSAPVPGPNPGDMLCVGIDHLHNESPWVGTGTQATKPPKNIGNLNSDKTNKVNTNGKLKALTSGKFIEIRQLITGNITENQKATTHIKSDTPSHSQQGMKRPSSIGIPDEAVTKKRETLEKTSEESQHTRQPRPPLIIITNVANFRIIAKKIAPITQEEATLTFTKEGGKIQTQKKQDYDNVLAMLKQDQAPYYTFQASTRTYKAVIRGLHSSITEKKCWKKKD